MDSLGLGFGHMWWGLAAALAESVGGLLIAAGLFFRPTAVVLAFVMLVATVNHIVTGVGTASHAFKNIWVFVALYLIGPGRYSIDHLLGRPSSVSTFSKASWR
jgi:putative oxidoreductase